VSSPATTGTRRAMNARLCGGREVGGDHLGGQPARDHRGKVVVRDRDAASSDPAETDQDVQYRPVVKTIPGVATVTPQ
jgi:hypothetical protein